MGVLNDHPLFFDQSADTKDLSDRAKIAPAQVPESPKSTEEIVKEGPDSCGISVHSFTDSESAFSDDAFIDAAADDDEDMDSNGSDDTVKPPPQKNKIATQEIQEIDDDDEDKDSSKSIDTQIKEVRQWWLEEIRDTEKEQYTGSIQDIVSSSGDPTPVPTPLQSPRYQENSAEIALLKMIQKDVNELDAMADQYDNIEKTNMKERKKKLDEIKNLRKLYNEKKKQNKRLRNRVFGAKRESRIDECDTLQETIFYIKNEMAEYKRQAENKRPDIASHTATPSASGTPTPAAGTPVTEYREFCQKVSEISQSVRKVNQHQSDSESEHEEPASAPEKIKVAPAREPVPDQREATVLAKQSASAKKRVPPAKKRAAPAPWR